MANIPRCQRCPRCRVRNAQERRLVPEDGTSANGVGRPPGACAGLEGQSQRGSAVRLRIRARVRRSVPRRGEAAGRAAATLSPGPSASSRSHLAGCHATIRQMVLRQLVLPSVVAAVTALTAAAVVAPLVAQQPAGTAAAAYNPPR